MKPYYKDNHNTIYCLDFRQNELPDESIQMVVTSPPYWGLRKYSGEQDLIWGGKDCEHQWGEQIKRTGGAGNKTPSGFQQLSQAGQIGSLAQTKWAESGSGSFCSLCGAWKGAYGLEPTPEMYIEHTIEILREIRRVLRKDGVVFWNIGDCYSATRWSDARGTGAWSGDRKKEANPVINRDGANLPAKNLCLIPFSVAKAAQEDGWWVRSVIIWSKPNPMPESCNDRPTESHEYILMLTKSGTTQYWTHRDLPGTRTQPKPDYRWIKRITRGRGLITKGLQQPNGQEQRTGPVGDADIIVEETDIKPEGWTPKNKKDWDRVNLWKGHDYYWDADAVREPHTTEFRPTRPETSHGKEPTPSGQSNNLTYNKMHPAGRNIRSVWEFPTQPYPEAHFAVFPEKLPEKCIKAATPEVGCCSKCGAPWERIRQPTEEYAKLLQAVRKGNPNLEKELAKGKEQGKIGSAQRLEAFHAVETKAVSAQYETLGWQPSCQCCRKCDIIGLSTNERKVAHATQRQGTGEGVETEVEQGALGNQCGASQEEQGEATKVSESMRPMPQGLYGQGEQPILQSDLLNEMDVGEQTGEPLPADGEEQPISIQVEQGENCKASQANNGGSSGETTSTQRVSASPQRGQKRQSDRELGSADKADTRTKAYQETHELEPYAQVPSIVLDPFAGAGTTLWVAKKLNRRAVGYEISEEYCELIVERNRQQVLL